MLGLFINGEGTRVDVIDEVMWRPALDCAADWLCGSKDLLDCAGQVTGHWSGSHGLGDADNIFKGDVAIVLDWKENRIIIYHMHI